MLYHILFISAVQQNGSAICIHKPPPSRASPRPPRPSQSSELGSRHAQQLPISSLSHPRQGVYATAAVPGHPAPSSPLLGPLISLLCLHLHSFPIDRFIHNVFLGSTYIHYYMILVFLFLTCFTPYNKHYK